MSSTPNCDSWLWLGCITKIPNLEREYMLNHDTFLIASVLYMVISNFDALWNMSVFSI